MRKDDADGLADIVVMTVKAAIAPLQAAIATVQTQLATLGDLQRDIAALRERVAVTEVRPGPAGPAGPAGADGQDGFGFDDLSVTFDGDRTLTLTFTRDSTFAGQRTKSFPIVLPFLSYQGVYSDGKMYAPGDVVTHAGSAWHCNSVTALKPGDGSPDWTLMVKRGSQGAQGIAGRDSYPVAKVS